MKIEFVGEDGHPSLCLCGRPTTNIQHWLFTIQFRLFTMGDHFFNTEVSTRRCVSDSWAPVSQIRHCIPRVQL
jgi:hypothetical protein